MRVVVSERWSVTGNPFLTTPVMAAGFGLSDAFGLYRTPTTDHRSLTTETMILGLTGDIACGKSTVAGILAGLGAVVLDADKLVHELYADPHFAAQVAALFDQPILDANGVVDRTKLAGLVFGDSAALRRLEVLVHPAVAVLRDQKIEAIQQMVPAPPIVLEAVKLIESGQAQRCDAVWCVTCRPEIQLARLMEARGLSKSAARQRLEQQPPFSNKAALLGVIPLVMIENNGPLGSLERRVKAEWDMWLRGETS